ncbi:ABC transporter ATP-binding protein [Kordiimonas marina]|uniref:ABC transporter ATP-binding protein n=1 Tax=Kordiimonas marina TaxID=2872312 RepID=UPI001FF1558D|nr:ABC transporter ATP-binding protein [Kordiimonas marina]MCJ9429634.1 ABC transporter ATP-binding protein [Kordiimonas marina]
MMHQSAATNDSKEAAKRTPFVEIQSVTKCFDDFCAVDDVNLTIGKGELFSILGGSGSGKTTLLRMLAGFERPDKGSILIDGQDITELPPYERPVNMMFQSYALFPHMTVTQNIAYGLKRDGVAKDEIADRVQAMLKLVQLEDFGKRKPSQLSGGQCQRVALARALVKKPKVLLLDEPTGALDKKLREQTQFEIANIQYELGITFIVVTHDQEEAMNMSDRIAVMNKGSFQQVGTPHQVYENPQTKYVADFIGGINLVDGVVKEPAGEGAWLIELPDFDMSVPVACAEQLQAGQAVTAAIRPEKLFVSTSTSAEPGYLKMPGILYDQGYFGRLSLFKVRLPSGHIITATAQNRVRTAHRAIDWDENVHLSFDPKSMMVLTK